MRKCIENFYRQDLFDTFNNRVNPFSFVTIKIDITSAYNYSRKHKHLYAVLCYCFTKAMNRIDNFKYRAEDGKIVFYDTIKPSYTEMLDNGDVVFITLDNTKTLMEFITLSDLAKKELKAKQKSIDLSHEETGEVWLSCLPWFKFTGVVPPFDKSASNPQIIWDKFEIVDDKVYINAMIMAHHGFVDGAHIGKLVQYIEAELAAIKED